MSYVDKKQPTYVICRKQTNKDTNIFNIVNEL